MTAARERMGDAVMRGMKPNVRVGPRQPKLETSGNTGALVGGAALGGLVAAGLGALLKKKEKEKKKKGYRKGGRVKKTGKALVHKGEFVLPRGVEPTKWQLNKMK